MAGLIERVVGGCNAKMIAVANNKIRAECMDKVYLLRLNARRLPFPDNTFDIVLCASFSFNDNHEKHIFMDEFRRVLKPGGKLILENVSPIYGQIERLVRLRVSLNEIPGKLIFPGLEQRIMKGYRKRRELGIGFPLFSKLAVIFGEDRMIKITRALGNVPLLKFFGYSIITELEKEPTTARGFEILG
jgi:ubiquinone/menaquinone biosynthesis C-methylase UbiE